MSVIRYYTKFIEVRAKSQGMSRKRREGKWVYYKWSQSMRIRFLRGRRYAGNFSR